MPKLHPLQRRTFAKHEIGHVILILQLGGTFENVEIKSDGDERLDGVSVTETVRSLGWFPSGVVRRSGASMTDRTFVIMTMGGIAGERVNRKNVGRLTFADLLGGAMNDWEQAKKVCTPAHLKMWGDERSATDVKTYLNQCLSVAHEIIVLCKDVHTKLVTLLLEKGKLTYKECKEIWDTAVRDRNARGEQKQAHAIWEKYYF
jgi:hypothetical protein